ncbi:MAG: AAA family ATPase [Acidiferrobacteraceae bacterium]
MSPVTFKAAKRENIPLLIGLAGGTGSGKTFSAMRIAKGLAGGKRFAMIDTEADRGKHYAEEFEFDHAPLGPPFRPGAYLEAIKAAEQAGYGVILVDSMSHEWDGTGGMLEWHDEIMGSDERKKLTAWIKPKTDHRRFVNELLQLKAHLVLCFRAQKKVEMVKDPSTGKFVIVEKQSLTGLDGWIPICEKNLPFELTVSLLLTADQPGIPHPIKLQNQHRAFVPLNAPLTEATGVALGRWAAGADGSAQEWSKDIKAEADRLTKQALELTSNPDAAGAIAKVREKYAHDPGAFLAWLGAQIENKRAEVEKASQEELAL